MLRFLLLACCLACYGGSASAQTTVPIGVHWAYLHIDAADVADAAVPIDLSSLGLVPGYVIGLETAGDWGAGPGGDVQTNLLAVFSSNDALLAPSARARVPGAIDAGTYNFSGGTYPGNEPTDIPEDFLVGRPGLTIVIPPGATHLFVTPADIYYRDNSDPNGNLGVTITLISTAAVLPGGSGPARFVLSVHPNPFTAATSIAFRLESAGPMRLTIHDVAGRVVRTLLATNLPPGSHDAHWNGRDASGRSVPAGTYFARLEAGGRVQATSAILIP